MCHFSYTKIYKFQDKTKKIKSDKNEEKYVLKRERTMRSSIENPIQKTPTREKFLMEAQP